MALNLLRQQRKRTKGAREEEEMRTKSCMFRLLNVLFSDRFFQAFLESGHQLRREELDQGGTTFWTDVATAFSSDNNDYDSLISGDAVFEGVDPVFVVAHSAAKLRRMWEEVSSNFARAEAGSKVSGQNGQDFWDYCSGRADVYYLDRWCEHRGAGQEFCAANVYSDDADDSTEEGSGKQKPSGNRKRRKSSQGEAVAEMLDTVKEMLENESNKKRDDAWVEQKLLLQEQRAAQKLSMLSAMLERTNAGILQLKELRREYITKGIDAGEIGRALAKREEKNSLLEEQLDTLEFEVLNGIQ